MDIPGKRYIGLITADWPIMIKEGETTNYIGDIIAGVVAENEDTARKAVELLMSNMMSKNQLQMYTLQ
jgi:xanthine dehydrogenase molybdopterin-binding subunit B